MKRGLTLVLAAAFAVAGVALAVADDKEAGGCSAKSESACGAASDCALKCPISGKAASKDATVDYKGGKVSFCCPGCISKFKKETAKYQAKANEQLVLSGQFKQVGCPISGGKVDPSTAIKVCGVDVAFCCKGCQGKVKKAAAEKQCETVFVKGFDKAFAKKEKETKKSKENI